MLYLRW